MVTSLSEYGTTSGTAVITRAKTGAREYYSNGKLEVIESTQATKRINPVTGQTEQWIELVYTPAGVSYATGNAISRSTSKSSTPYATTETTQDIMQFTEIDTKSSVIGKPLSTTIQTQTTEKVTPKPNLYLELALQKQNERLGYGISSQINPEYNYSKQIYQSPRATFFDIAQEQKVRKIYQQERETTIKKNVAYTYMTLGGLTPINKDTLKNLEYNAYNPLTTIQKVQSIFNPEKRAYFYSGEEKINQAFIAKYQEENYSNFGEYLGMQVSPIFSKDITKERAFSSLYENLKTKMPEEQAYKQTVLATKAYNQRAFQNVLTQVGVSATSNIIGGTTYKAVKGWGIAKGYSTKTITKLGAISLAPAGAYEATALYAGYTYERGQTPTLKEGAIWAGVGAISAPLVQYAIDRPLIGKQTLLKKGISRGVQGFAYATDLLELPGDIASTTPFISKGSVRTVYAYTPSTYTNIKSNIIELTPVQEYKQRKIFSFTQTKNKPKVSSFTDIQVIPTSNIQQSTFKGVNINVNTKTTALTNLGINTNIMPTIGTEITPYQFTGINTRTKTLTKVNTQTDILTRNNINALTNVNPFVNTRTNINPYVNTNVITNVFTGKIPLIPFLPSGGRGGGYDFSFRPKTRQRKGYLPSLTALGLGIKGKRSRFAELSGLTIRPIVR